MGDTWGVLAEEMSGKRIERIIAEVWGKDEDVA